MMRNSQNIYADNNHGKQNFNRNTTIKIGSTIIIIGILVVLFFAGKNFLNSPSKQIVGTWQTEGGFTYVFNEGTYSHDGGWMGTYSIEGNKLILCPVLNDPEIYTIKLSSKSLNIYKNGELYRELKRIN